MITSLEASPKRYLLTRSGAKNCQLSVQIQSTYEGSAGSVRYVPFLIINMVAGYPQAITCDRRIEVQGDWLLGEKGCKGRQRYEEKFIAITIRMLMLLDGKHRGEAMNSFVDRIAVWPSLVDEVPEVRFAP